MSNNTRSDEGSPTTASTGTSDTNFGKSIESQAQIKDAATNTEGEAGETLNIYRLVPTAAPDDPRWQNSPGSGEVVVAARTTGDARIVASAHEVDFMEIDAAPAEGNTTANASAFRDEKLYTVIEVERDRTDVARGVIEGNVSINALKSTRA